MMWTVLATVFLTLCFTEGRAGLDSVIKTILKVKELGRGCATATDLKFPRDDITFWLYTRSTQHNPTKLNQCDLSLLSSAPWVEAPLKFIVHGYSVDRETAVNAALRPAYFEKGDYNIISVDWSPLGREGCYYHATMNVPTIAHCVAQFFSAVVRSRDFSSVHLLGHSMGAHIVSWASYELESLPRLTKFDPALPLFSEGSPMFKKGEADIVDVYHSNCGLKGTKVTEGTIDIFFNSEAFQPGCKCDTGCSHQRAVDFYAESISNPKEMRAFPCEGWRYFRKDKCPVPAAEDLVIVGEELDGNKRGVYMMFTNATSPYILPYSLYLDKVTFKHFKKTAHSDCRVISVLDAIKDWIS